MSGKLGWSSEKVEAVRKELLEEGKTLKEIAAREHVTYQAIMYHVGRLNRGNSRMQANQQRVLELVKAGKTDAEIAQETGLGKRYVSLLRRAAGIKYLAKPKTQTPEHSLKCAHKWVELYGYTPAAADWNPAVAVRSGQKERANRYGDFRQEYKAPHTNTVRNQFGSWSEFIRQTGLPPAKAGGAGHGRYKLK
jgi:DNA-binding CsgD family transcriptional regulator